jgi:chemotaxis protein MotB
VARKKKHPAHENHERWLVSYADFITLLFAFFVVMFATGQTDKAKAKQVSEAVKEALEHGGVPAIVKEILGGTVDEKGKGNAQMKGPGGAQKTAKDPKPEITVKAELLPSLQFLTAELKQDIDSGKLQISMQPRGLVVSLREAAFFPSAADTMAPATFASIAKIAGVINKLPNSVRLEGHTDAQPIHTSRFRSNWELSAARGIAVMEVLSGRFAVPVERLAIAGYADTVPVDSNGTEEGRMHNRRVDIVILGREALTKEPAAAAEGKKAPEASGAAKPPVSVAGAAHPPAAPAPAKNTETKKIENVKPH